MAVRAFGCAIDPTDGFRGVVVFTESLEIDVPVLQLGSVGGPHGP